MAKANINAFLAIRNECGIKISMKHSPFLCTNAIAHNFLSTQIQLTSPYKYFLYSRIIKKAKFNTFDIDGPDCMLMVASTK